VISILGFLFEGTSPPLHYVHFRSVSSRPLSILWLAFGLVAVGLLTRGFFSAWISVRVSFLLVLFFSFLCLVPGSVPGPRQSFSYPLICLSVI
jgi:hypothetical protein